MKNLKRAHSILTLVRERTDSHETDCALYIKCVLSCAKKLFMVIRPKEFFTNFFNRPRFP